MASLPGNEPSAATSWEWSMRSNEAVKLGVEDP